MFLSRFGLAGLGIGNTAMLSDVEAAVTSQAGVLDLPFVKNRAGAQWAGAYARRREPCHRRGRFCPTMLMGFQPSMPDWRPMLPTHALPQATLQPADFAAIPSP